ncbi:MAG: CrcB family protein [Acidimicrobiales bacterium]|jgi:CrcB protein|nr:CrcB family protein [Acidimicrobiales bacterium]
MHEHPDHAEIPVDPDLVDAEPVHAPGEPAPAAFRPDLRLVAAVAAGGALGAPARYALSELLPRDAGELPVATLLANVVGSLLLGVVVIWLLERFRPTRYLRAFVGTGVLGAFTTMSTFAAEATLLVRDDAAVLAGVYVALTVVLGLGAARLGMTLGRELPHHVDHPAHPRHRAGS